MFIMSNEKDKLIITVKKEVENLLGTIGYDSMSNDDKNSLMITIAINEGVLINEITPEFILNYHKKTSIASLNATCEQKINDGFVASNGHTYRTNRDDQINMIGQKDILLSNQAIIKVMWKAEDEGTWIEHTREEWLQIYAEAFEHKQAQLLKYNTLKQQVINATTHEEVLIVKW